MSLRCVGLCGVDESVDPSLVSAIASRWPRTELGVLFRPGREGQPRYPRLEWVERLASTTTSPPLRLAAHLCGAAVDAVLAGDVSFVTSTLVPLGFRRVQLNATKRNGCTGALRREALFEACRAVPEVEFIVQANDETAALWALPADCTKSDEEALLLKSLPSNLSLLFDASCGAGQRLDAKGAETALTERSMFRSDAARRATAVGVAGGISPSNVAEVLAELRATPAFARASLWIDMESGLRTRDERDRFDANAAWGVCVALDAEGWDNPSPPAGIFPIAGRLEPDGTEAHGTNAKDLPPTAKVSRHAVLAHKVTLLRDRRTKPRDFRALLKEITFYVGYEVTAALPTADRHDCVAPAGVAVGAGTAKRLNARVALVPVMRAGLGMLDPLLDMVPNAAVHQIGMFKRGGAFDRPIEYYSRLPKNGGEDCDLALVLDPVIATSRTVHAVVQKLKSWGARKIAVLGVLASAQGLKTLARDHPDVDVYVAQVDDRLSREGELLPGLGDPGDRIYGPPEGARAAANDADDKMLTTLPSFVSHSSSRHSSAASLAKLAAPPSLYVDAAAAHKDQRAENPETDGLSLAAAPAGGARVGPGSPPSAKDHGSGSPRASNDKKRPRSFSHDITARAAAESLAAAAAERTARTTTTTTTNNADAGSSAASSDADADADTNNVVTTNVGENTTRIAVAIAAPRHDDPGSSSTTENKLVPHREEVLLHGVGDQQHQKSSQQGSGQRAEEEEEEEEGPSSSALSHMSADPSQSALLLEEISPPEFTLDAKDSATQLTTHDGSFGATPARMAWGARAPLARGPVLATTRHASQRNAIGAHAGGYSIYRALAVASGGLDTAAMPKLELTTPAVKIGPHASWFDASKIVTMDPWGHDVADAFGPWLDKGYDARPTIAVTKAHVELPECKEAMRARRLVPDGVVLNETGTSVVTKAAIEPVWYLPGVAARFGVSERDLRDALFAETNSMYPELITRHDLKLFLPPIGGMTVYIWGAVDKIPDPNVELTCRVHDECNGSDVFGSDICTCRPYLTHAIEECIKTAQRGGTGICVYFRKEGRALGEVTKYLVYNMRKRQRGGDVATEYFNCTQSVAGVTDTRFQALMPDVLHWLGVTRIHRFVSMSDMKFNAITESGIEVLERIEIPPEMIPKDAQVEIAAKVHHGYHGGKSYKVDAQKLKEVKGREYY